MLYIKVSIKSSVNQVKNLISFMKNMCSYVCRKHRNQIYMWSKEIPDADNIIRDGFNHIVYEKKKDCYVVHIDYEAKTKDGQNIETLCRTMEEGKIGIPSVGVFSDIVRLCFKCKEVL